MQFDEQTITVSAIILKKGEGRNKFTLTPKGEALIRAGLGDKVPSDAKLELEATEDGIRFIATFSGSTDESPAS